MQVSDATAIRPAATVILWRSSPQGPLILMGQRGAGAFFGHLAGGAFEGFCGRAEIARAVVDDSYTHVVQSFLLDGSASTSEPEQGGSLTRETAP